ncbi:phage holin family protein [Propionicicella superfundia]|uniref:phage holin family protein n=1 Tax=Propionicicella superfundia TaxID=348582 RepID=UPI000406E1CF|nr:phage holin family protein [Propionicicella superfundia]
MADSDPRGTIQDITADVKALVQAEVALAKAELLPKAKSAGIGAGLLGAAGYFAICAAGLLYIAASIGVGILLGGAVGTVPGIALGFVIVGVVMLILAGLLAFVGQGKLKELKDATPELTVANAQGAVTDVKDAVTRGKDSVPASVFQRQLGA